MLPWRAWLASPVAADMGLATTDMQTAVAALHFLHTNPRLGKQYIEIEYEEGGNRANVRATEDLEAFVLQIPSCMPKPNMLYGTSERPSRVPVSVTRRMKSAVADADGALPFGRGFECLSPSRMEGGPR